MAASHFISRTVSRLLAHRLLRNFAWLTGADLATRVVRILSVAVVARLIDADAFGIAALLLSTHELLKVGAQIGTGQSIIRTGKNDLAGVAKTCFRLNFLSCGALALLQVGVACVIGMTTGSVDAAALGCFLALVFVGMPFGLVHVFMALRKEQADRVAQIAAVQNMVDSVLSVVLALCGFGVWSLVLPKVLTMPIWLIGVRCLTRWKPDRTVTPAPWRPIVAFGLPILGSEALGAARLHLDKPIIGALLGVEALGIWFLATSAGMGLAQAVSSAFTLVLMPHLCKEGEGEGRRARFDRFARAALPVLTIVFFMQALAAPIYVPLVFGEQWGKAASIVAILCVAGGPRLLWDSVVQLARSEGRTTAELFGTIALTGLSLTALVAGAQNGLLTAAVAMTATAILTQLILSAWLRFGVLPATSRKEAY